MNDKIKKLKQQEQENVVWEMEPTSELVVKESLEDERWRGMRAGLICGLIGMSAGLLGVLVGDNPASGFDIGRILPIIWLAFFIPPFSGTRKYPWVAVAIYLFLVAGGFGLFSVWWFWWVVAIVPIWLGWPKQEKA